MVTGQGQERHGRAVGGGRRTCGSKSQVLSVAGFRVLTARIVRFSPPHSSLMTTYGWD